jgi:2-polyprenyl-3-methyl-5-hydroxy-6-metoxy-1,4-benzoquinol methylase
MKALDLPQEKQNLSLLDVGCGDGKYSLTAKALGLTVSALDACPGMVSSLGGKVDSAQVIDWEAYSVAVLYDRVLCAGMLDFVVEPEGSFKKLCQSVDSKGRLVVLVPKHGIGGIFYRVEKYLSGFRVNLYRVEQLERWARQEGLTLTTTSHPLPSNMVLSFERG